MKRTAWRSACSTAKAATGDVAEHASSAVVEYSFTDQIPAAETAEQSQAGALAFSPYGKVLELIDDCISYGIDKLIAERRPGLARSRLCGLREQIRAELNGTVVEVAKQVEQILTAVFNINKRLKRPGGYVVGAGAIRTSRPSSAGWFTAAS